MLSAYAIDPDVVCSWCKKENFRYFSKEFGRGTPRILYEIPKFNKWRSRITKSSLKKDLKSTEKKNLEILIEKFGRCRYKNPHLRYDGDIGWLENAEKEYSNRPYSGIISVKNPRSHPAVIESDSIGGEDDERWDKPIGIVTKRSPRHFADALEGVLFYSRRIRLVDPYFGPDNPRHRYILEAFLKKIATRLSYPEFIEIHCGDKIPEKTYFEEKAKKLMSKIPNGVKVYFFRWKEKDGGEKFHNRYILTEHCGITVGTGLDRGEESQSDDLNLMSKEQYEIRKKQFDLNNPAFELVDQPKPLIREKFI